MYILPGLARNVQLLVHGDASKVVALQEGHSKHVLCGEFLTMWASHGVSYLIREGFVVWGGARGGG